MSRSLLLLAVLSATGLVAACNSSGSIAEASGADGGDQSTTDGGGGFDAGPPRPSDPATIQMNDVSILLPLPRSAAEGDLYIKASDAARGGMLLPKASYDEATGEDADAGPAPGGSLPVPHAGLRVVSIRLDPCFANIGPVTSVGACQNQLRLVLQPFFADADGHVKAVDSAVHAFYLLTRDELVAMVTEIKSLRAASGSGAIDLGPLAVHPIATREGATGPFMAGLTKLVLAHAGEANFFRFTRIQIGNANRTWIFSGFDVASGKSTGMIVPKVPGDATSVTFFQGFADDLEGQFNPATTSKDDMQILGNVVEAQDATKDVQRAAFDSALRIENPNKNSPNTIDCASCHLAAPSRALTGKALGLSADGNANAFSITSSFIPVEDLAITTPQKDALNGVNVHVFSYKDDQAMIAPRAVNETAAIVDYLNATR